MSRPAPRRFASYSPELLAVVDAVRSVGIEFGDWYVAPGPRCEAICGHIQVANRHAVSRLLEALLDIGAGIDVDVEPATNDPAGRWAIRVRAYPLDPG
ncbi:MAG TPA: hypothetical protein VG755_20065 [Nannocystaceae bacterium]|nr:hypothetical protein [Nannocystaceae bacterium]